VRIAQDGGRQRPDGVHVEDVRVRQQDVQGGLDRRAGRRALGQDADQVAEVLGLEHLRGGARPVHPEEDRRVVRLGQPGPGGLDPDQVAVLAAEVPAGPLHEPEVLADESRVPIEVLEHGDSHASNPSGRSRSVGLAPPCCGSRRSRPSPPRGAARLWERSGMGKQLFGLAAGLVLLVPACGGLEPERELALEVNQIYRDSDGEALLGLLCPDAREELLDRLGGEADFLLAFEQDTAGENPTVVFGRSLDSSRSQLTVRKPGRDPETLEVRHPDGEACLAPLGSAAPPPPTPIPTPSPVTPEF
jgi:hypothetical protein